MTHERFVLVASLSFVLTTVDLYFSGHADELVSMLSILAPVLVSVVVVLFVTRKHWRGWRTVNE
ncbi:MAG: hypothetical protein HY296_06060 [Thaumarchaeota archaeon]|nr:hypothetical protein [Nitrososphaerota archaeon]